MCHSPLDKRNRAGKKKGRKSKEDQVAKEGDGNGLRHKTSTRVLFSSTQFDKVDVKKPA